LEEAKKIIKTLLSKNKTRKEKTEKIIEEIEKRIENKKDPLVFEGDKSFDSALLSSVASVISRSHSKPAFLYKKMAKETQGTVRVPNNLNSVDLMKKCSKYLLTYGGHPQASGFRVKNKNLEKFRICLINNLKRMKP
jgi:single-stranded DNA-specific DHH superfamily exonuclease